MSVRGGFAQRLGAQIYLASAFPHRRTKPSTRRPHQNMPHNMYRPRPFGDTGCLGGKRGFKIHWCVCVVCFCVCRYSIPSFFFFQPVVPPLPSRLFFFVSSVSMVEMVSVGVHRNGPSDLINPKHLSPLRRRRTSPPHPARLARVHGAPRVQPGKPLAIRRKSDRTVCIVFLRIQMPVSLVLKSIVKVFSKS